MCGCLVVLVTVVVVVCGGGLRGGGHVRNIEYICWRDVVCVGGGGGALGVGGGIGGV